jgi:3-phenylpropionate/cinnamic acid dioxygenase small subunit
MTAVAEGPTVTVIGQADAEQFLYQEARLADAHDYDAWEALWTDDAIYWVPAGGESAEDPTTQVSVLFDNRSRIGTRIRQLKSGKRHSQTPKSNVVHSITNVEVLGLHENGDTEITASLLAVESRERGTVLWAGRVEYRIRRVDGELKLAWKKVTLVDRDQPLYTLSFLI